MTAAQVLDLTNWKLTLPTGEDEHPEELLSAELLKGTERAPWFTSGVDAAGFEYVDFRAAVNGVTTGGSSNPRSELRQMIGSKAASWSADIKGYWTFTQEMSFRHGPNMRTDGGNAAVVGGQIHDSKDDFCVFRLEGPNLWLTLGNTTHYKLLMNNYSWGTVITTAFVVGNKKVRVYLNGKLVATIKADKLKGAYFKAGAYTQAHSGNSEPDDETNYGEVRIYRLSVSKSDTPGAVTFPTRVPTTPPADQPPTEPVPPPVDTPPVEQPPTQPMPPVTPTVPKAKRTIIMLRHGEKDDNDDGKDDTLHELSKRGNERRVALEAAWTDGKTPYGLPKPDRYIASKGNTASNRPLKTIEPIQIANDGPMNTRYDFEVDYKTVGPWLGQRLDVTMVCCEHSAIIDTFKLLGPVVEGLPKAWDENRFDLYWVFTSDDGRNWKLTQIPQLLLSGDKTSTIK